MQARSVPDVTFRAFLCFKETVIQHLPALVRQSQFAKTLDAVGAGSTVFWVKTECSPLGLTKSTSTHLAVLDSLRELFFTAIRVIFATRPLHNLDLDRSTAKSAMLLKDLFQRRQCGESRLRRGFLFAIYPALDRL